MVILEGRRHPRRPPGDPGGAARWITGPARRDGHKLRAWADAVMVGATTARLDDLSLNVREVRGTGIPCGWWPIPT
ncbi:MAG: dihydrofolate reductase family protein [bacterium]